MTNVQLKRWKILDTDLCTFCGREIESITHLLIDCDLVRGFWMEMKELLLLFTDSQISLTCKNIMFNSVVNQPKHICNFLCLIAKQYIYASRCKKEVPKMSQYRNIVNRIQNVEKNIAIKNNKVKLHFKKWRSGCSSTDIGDNGNLNIDLYIRQYIDYA